MKLVSSVEEKRSRRKKDEVRVSSQQLHNWLCAVYISPILLLFILLSTITNSVVFDSLISIVVLVIRIQSISRPCQIPSDLAQCTDSTYHHHSRSTNSLYSLAIRTRVSHVSYISQSVHPSSIWQIQQTQIEMLNQNFQHEQCENPNAMTKPARKINHVKYTL